MFTWLTSARAFRVLAAAGAIGGNLMLIVSFLINTGPPTNATREQLIEFGNQHFAAIVWGAWLQAVGPVFIIAFALAVVVLAGATSRLAGWLTLFGASVLMTVSLVEITFYISALEASPPDIGLTSLGHIYAVQHLYFIVGAPALFIPLGAVIAGSDVLPRLFGYLAILLGLAFAVLGIATLFSLIVPVPVTAFAGVQTLWWFAAAVAVALRRSEDARKKVPR